LAELAQHALRLEEDFQRGPSPEPGRSSEPPDILVGPPLSAAGEPLVSLYQEQPSSTREAASEGGGQTRHQPEASVIDEVLTIQIPKRTFAVIGQERSRVSEVR
jgi:hypothetical protein